MLPMLAAPKGPRRPDWVAHQKLDGHRRAITIADGKITGWSRKGHPAELPGPLRTQLEVLADIGWRITLDGELMADGTWWAFDLPELDNGRTAITGRYPLAARLDALDRLFQAWSPDPAVTRVVPTARGTEEVELLVKRVLALGGEGVVHKDPGSAYLPGVRSQRWRKQKHYVDVDCVASGFRVDNKGRPGRDAHDNIGLAMWTGRKWQHVGEVSRLTGDGPRVQIGDVVAVQILYSTPDDRLYQPTKPRVRDDKDPHDCVTSQLDDCRMNRAVIDTL